MAKKQLSKMILLPLFLAGITLGAAGVLTGAHLLTAPVIENNKEQKKLEGYKLILGLDASANITLSNVEMAKKLSDKGVSKKNKVMVGSDIIGVVYDATIKGWEAGLTFQVGFKDDVYAGFNLISSNETPGIGKDYLSYVNDRIKGVKIDQPVLLNDGSYTGPTAPITGGALKEVLELCAADYALGDGPIVEPHIYEEYIGALNIPDADQIVEVSVSESLVSKGVSKRYEVKLAGVLQGIVYEATVEGWNPGIHFLAGFKGNTYGGFYLLSSQETAGIGASYLNAINDRIKGVALDQPILIDDETYTGPTAPVTAAPIKEILGLMAADYLGEGEVEPEPTSLANLNAALNILTADDYSLVTLTQDLTDGGVLLKYIVLESGYRVGVVYEMKIRGFKDGLHFLVGFNLDKYAGFKLLASQETADYGGDYLTKINGWIKDLPAADPVLIDNPENAGVTKTVTALQTALGLAANDYLETMNPTYPETSLANLNAALNITTATTYNLLPIRESLKSGGVLLKYDVLVEGVSVGVVYEVKTKGFKDGMHFLVGFSGENYAGFKLIASQETPDYGGDYLTKVNGWIKDQPAADPILVGNPENVGVTRTVNGLKTAFELCADDFLEGSI